MNVLKEGNKEIELKLSLQSYIDYLKLKGYICKADSEIKQINIFYDTPSRQISKLGYALRLRLEPTRGIITLKSKTKSVSKVAVREEIEEFISLEKALEIKKSNNLLSLDIPSIVFLHSQIKNLSNLNPIITFENERIKKEILLGKNSYTFEVDKTTYSNKSVVYELEIELENIEEIDDAVSDIQKLFSILEIEFLAMKKSKFERALEIAGLI